MKNTFGLPYYTPVPKNSRLIESQYKTIVSEKSAPHDLMLHMRL